jgi:hypothetical protein
MVDDFLRAPAALLISWPDDFIAPNGQRPSNATLESAHAAVMSTADRVALSDMVAKHAQAKAVALERAIADMGPWGAASIMREASSHFSDRIASKIAVKAAFSRAFRTLGAGWADTIVRNPPPVLACAVASGAQAKAKASMLILCALMRFDLSFLQTSANPSKPAFSWQAAQLVFVDEMSPALVY